MIYFAVSLFTGEAPRVAPRQLPNNMAQLALNAKLWSTLEPFRNTLQVQNKPAANLTADANGQTNNTIYPFGQTMLGQDVLMNQPYIGSPFGLCSQLGGAGLVADVNPFGVDHARGIVTGVPYTPTAPLHVTESSLMWAHWPKDIDVARGAIPADASEHTYYTGDGVPKMTTIQMAAGATPPVKSYPLGIPAPTNKPTVTVVDLIIAASALQVGHYYTIKSLGSTDFTAIGAVSNTVGEIFKCTTAGTGSGTAVASGQVAESRSYVYTLVSIYGEESAPSLPSDIVSIFPDSTVTIGLPVFSQSVPDGNGGMTAGSLGIGSIPENITTQRIYRTNAGSNGIAEFQFVDEITIFKYNYADTKKATALGEILPSVGWLPPNPKMRGIMALPNGAMVGFFDNVISFSEPNKPYAWPIRNQYSVDNKMVAIGAYGTNVIALTVGNPYLLSGIDPAAMSPSKIPSQQPCVSKRSVVSIGSGVAYASPDGIIVIGAAGTRNATEKYLTRDEWQALKPASMNAYMLDGRYFCFYNNGTVAGGFILDPNTTEDGLVHIDLHATAGYADLVTDALYLMAVSDIVKWDAGATPMTMKWRSKVFVSPHPANLSFGKVRAAGYPVTFRVYADGALKLTGTIANEEAFRLPGGFLAKDWEFEIEGTKEIYSAIIADTIGALQNV